MENGSDPENQLQLKESKFSTQVSFDFAPISTKLVPAHTKIKRTCAQSTASVWRRFSKVPCFERFLIMQRTPVSSSNVTSIGYDPASECLEVEFKGGVVWHYTNMPAEKALEVMNATSVGKAVAAMKKEFTGVKGEAPESNPAPVKTKSVAQALHDLADKEGCSVEFIAKQTVLLKDAGINPKKVTPKTIVEAKAIDRAEMARIQAKVDELNKPILDAEKKELDDVVFKHVKKPATEVKVDLDTILEQVSKGEITPAQAKALLESTVSKPKNTPSKTTTAKTEPKSGSVQPKAGRSQLFGFSATAVMRWMGANGWDFDKAWAAFAGMGVDDLSETTFKIQLRAGAKGERGEPAAVTAAQAKELEAAAI